MEAHSASVAVGGVQRHHAGQGGVGDLILDGAVGSKCLRPGLEPAWGEVDVAAERAFAGTVGGLVERVVVIAEEFLCRLMSILPLYSAIT